MQTGISSHGLSTQDVYVEEWGWGAVKATLKSFRYLFQTFSTLKIFSFQIKHSFQASLLLVRISIFTSFQKSKENQDENRRASGQHSPPSPLQVPSWLKHRLCSLPQSHAGQWAGERIHFVESSTLVSGRGICKNQFWLEHVSNC